MCAANVGDTRVALLLLILRRGRITTAEAAQHLGRTGSQGRRYARDQLQLLASCGPVRAVGEERERTWVLDALGRPGAVTDADRVALIVGRDAVSFLEGTLLGEGLSKATDSGPGERPRFRSLDRKFLHLAEPQPAYERWSEQIDAIVDALARERRLDVVYDSGSGPKEHLGVEPLSMVVYRRAVYLVARRTDRPTPWRWRVDRMTSVRVGAAFEYPSDWDPRAELAPWFGMVTDPPPELVVLRFTAAVARHVRARRWHATAEMRELEDGGIQLEMRVGGRELVRFVLEWGQHCRVIAPDWLRDEVRVALR